MRADTEALPYITYEPVNNETCFLFLFLNFHLLVLLHMGRKRKN